MQAFEMAKWNGPKLKTMKMKKWPRLRRLKRKKTTYKTEHMTQSPQCALMTSRSWCVCRRTKTRSTGPCRSSWPKENGCLLRRQLTFMSSFIYGIMSFFKNLISNSLNWQIRLKIDSPSRFSRKPRSLSCRWMRLSSKTTQHRGSKLRTSSQTLRLEMPIKLQKESLRLTW